MKTTWTREHAIDIAKKCLLLAESPNTNEANLARETATNIINKYGLTKSDVEISNQPPTTVHVNKKHDWCNSDFPEEYRQNCKEWDAYYAPREKPVNINGKWYASLRDAVIAYYPEMKQDYEAFDEFLYNLADYADMYYDMYRAE